MIPFLATAGAYLSTLLLIRWVLLSRSRTPAASVAWILAILFLPILGGVLFIVFGINRVERRRRARLRSDREAERLIGSPWNQHTGVVPVVSCEPCDRVANVVENVCDFVPTSGNSVEIMADTNRTLGRIHQAILNAEHSIHLEYYIWQPDKTGRQLRDLLIQRANHGIEVRFLYDSLGSMWLKKRFFQPMREAGIEVSPFSPGESFRDQWSLNLRSHRKIVVVDGKVGFTGGMNIGDEYLGKIKTVGDWRDTHVRLEGPSVLQLQQVFVEDWFYATKNDLTDEKYYPAPDSSGTQRVQLASGGPLSEPRPFHAVFFTAIAEARDEILLTTSYFIPTEPLAMALEAAALRGVRVRLLVPGRTTHFFPLTILAGRSFYETLLASGCEIYEYDEGMLHAKTLVIDRRWSMVGTPNFDARSVQLNFEVAATFFDTDEASVLAQQFEDDLAKASPITTETREQQKTWQRIVENGLRLFAPVM